LITNNFHQNLELFTNTIYFFRKLNSINLFLLSKPNKLFSLIKVFQTSFIENLLFVKLEKIFLFKTNVF